MTLLIIGARAKPHNRAPFPFVMDVNDEYTRIGNKILAGGDFEEIRPFSNFVILSSDEEKKKNKKIVYGECKLVSKLYKWICPYDFFIIIYEPNIAGFSDEQLEILIEHELRHMGYDFNGNEPTPYIIPHDVEEFDAIIEKWGLHWDR